MAKHFNSKSSSKVPPPEGFREAYTLHLADTALILGHRNSEWCGHGPILEQDIAISNISLDLIGQARNFYQYAALLKADGSTEDTLAYFRDANEFKNLLLAEQPKGDWAQTTLRQFFFSAYQYDLYDKLKESSDHQLSAIASKALKEVSYHLRWSSEWVIRLGDGTGESNKRMANAIESLWSYTDEMFNAAFFETSLIAENIIPDISLLKEPWMKKVTEIFEEATLPVPRTSLVYTGGKIGQHTDHLSTILEELQSVARAYPSATW
ncbi:1,2-phenylacetyl-CoA epoxidase subunit PaaC [Terrimonas pollutisoli]|uniref:1,2-phenylacetyl-CoA epoxidase subunit PaaC n=1 Tax=Terrimonas pollutisoli TaxID=3034147 RepID=UPI0023EA7B55|nr:1,2-phenylacetyl-CoA epoxidase subunit PaaC [Terrimonas sp. H1YJ31]